MAVIDDLIAWWQFQEELPLLNDVDITALDLTESATAPTYATGGRAGRATFVNGTLDMLYVAATDDLAGRASTGYTIYMGATFTNWNSSGLQSPLACWKPNSAWRLYMQSNTLRLSVTDSTARFAATTEPIVKGNVYHVFITVTPESSGGAADGSFTLTILNDDGTTHDTATYSGFGTVFGGATNLCIGGQQADFAGGHDISVDVVAAWTRVLTSEEMATVIESRYSDIAVTTDPLNYHGGLQASAGMFTTRYPTRMIFCGDSYSWTHDGHSRPAGAFLHGVAVENWSAFCAGYYDGHAFLDALSGIVGGGTISNIDQLNNYDVENGTDTFGLPLFHAVEFELTALLNSPTYLTRFTIQNASMADGDTGPFCEAGDYVHVKPIFRKIDDGVTPFPALTLAGKATDLTQGTARQANAGLRGDLGSVGAGDVAFDLTISGAPAGDQYIDYLGTVVWKSASGNGGLEPGFYFSHIGDNSWTWGGHGADAESTTGQKQYSSTQLANWLEATTLDAAQKHVFMFYMDIEGGTQAEWKTKIEDAVASARAAATAAGVIGAVSFIAVIPWTKWGGVQGLTDDAWRVRCQNMREAAKEVAAADESFGWVSIFDATEGVAFDGSAAQDAWLTANGYATITYGTNVDVALTGNAMLDGSSGAHPVTEADNVFFNRFVTDVIPAAPSGSPSSPIRWLNKTGTSPSPNFPENLNLSLKKHARR